MQPLIRRAFARHLFPQGEKGQRSKPPRNDGERQAFPLEARPDSCDLRPQQNPLF